MRERLKKIWDKSLATYILLFVIITAQIIYLSCSFATNKDGYHSDEIFSYGLSNSYHNPFLVCDQSIYDTNASVFNIHEWVSGDVFQDYITVDANKTFDYANVWYNQSLDRHPPLYYAALHTICSFFPEQFSPWFGLGLNLVCFVVLQIFLFLLARKILRSSSLALLAVLCYGFSVGALSTFIYIRMYSMATMWIVVLVYFHARLLECRKSIKIKNLVPITLAVMLGVLTEHEFTIMAFVLAVCFCLYYLFKKQFKNFFKYACSMLLGVLLAWAIFIPLMYQIFIEATSNIAVSVSFETFSTQFPLACFYSLTALFGINPPTSGTWIFAGTMTLTAICLVIVFAIPICFLFRDSKGFAALKDKFKNSGKNFVAFIKRFRPRKIIQALGRVNILCLSMLIMIVIIAIMASRTTIFWLMTHCDRYVFVSYPFVLLVAVSLVYWLIRKIKLKVIIKGGKLIVSVLFVCLLINNIKNVQTDYYFEGAHNIGDLSEITADSDCIVVDDIAWRMECFAVDLRNVDHVFYAVDEYLDEVWDEMNDFEASKPLYLIVLAQNASLDGEIMAEYTVNDVEADEMVTLSEAEYIEKYFASLKYCTKVERMGVISVYLHNYAVYRLN